jgi:hypothetical protein
MRISVWQMQGTPSLNMGAVNCIMELYLTHSKTNGMTSWRDELLTVCGTIQDDTIQYMDI